MTEQSSPETAVELTLYVIRNVYLFDPTLKGRDVIPNRPAKVSSVSMSPSLSVSVLVGSTIAGRHSTILLFPLEFEPKPHIVESSIP